MEDNVCLPVPCILIPDMISISCSVQIYLTQVWNYIALVMVSFRLTGIKKKLGTQKEVYKYHPASLLQLENGTAFIYIDKQTLVKSPWWSQNSHFNTWHVAILWQAMITIIYRDISLGSQDTIFKHNIWLSSIVIAAVCSKESCMNNWIFVFSAKVKNVCGGNES